MNTATKTDARLFLTDYASYNNGTQFEFGHWVDLSQFSDAGEFMEYIRKHFEEADEKSPLDNYGSKREEIMFTDFEGFPKSLYSESMSSNELERLFEFLNLDDDDKMKCAFILEQTGDIKYALEHYENVYLYEDSDRSRWDIFEQCYPEAEKLIEQCPYISIDYDHFIDENFTEFEYEGESYLVDNSWNY